MNPLILAAFITTAITCAGAVTGYAIWWLLLDEEGQ